MRKTKPPVPESGNGSKTAVKEGFHWSSSGGGTIHQETVAGMSFEFARENQTYDFDI